MLARKRPGIIEIRHDDVEESPIHVRTGNEPAPERHVVTETKTESAAEATEVAESIDERIAEEEVVPTRWVPRAVKNALLSAVILFVLFIGAGLVYTYFSGSDTLQPTVATRQVAASTSDGEIKPPTPSPKAPESAAIELLSSPIRQGEQASVSVKTQPQSTCTITQEFNNVVTRAAGLTKNTSDEFGTVTWDWKISKSMTPGMWQVKITCAYHGRTAFVQGDMYVTD